jgi:membrane protein
MFPAIGALVSIYGIFADPATIQAQLTNLSSLLPGGAIEIIEINYNALHRAERALWALPFLLVSRLLYGVPTLE